MRLSSKKIKKEVRREILEMLYQVLADFRDPKELEILAKHFFGVPLSLTLAKKIAIINWLGEGKDYEQICKGLGVSTATIASLQKETGTNPALRLIKEKISTEKWAEKWSQRIGALFRKEQPLQNAS